MSLWPQMIWAMRGGMPMWPHLSPNSPSAPAAPQCHQLWRRSDLLGLRDVCRQSCEEQNLMRQVARPGEQEQGQRACGWVAMGELGIGATRAVKTAAPRRMRWWSAGGNAKGRSSWTRGWVLAALAVLTAVLLAFHRLVPNFPGHLGSLLESFLPWSGLVIVVLLGLALLCRSALALVSLLLPVAAWTYLFGGLLLPGAKPGAHDLFVVQHNVSDENTDPAGTARALADAEPDLIGLEELVPAALPVYERTFASRYRYHAAWAPSDSGRNTRSPTSRSWTSNPLGSQSPGAAGFGPWSTRRTVKSRCTSRTCPLSASKRPASPRPGATKAPVSWARSSPPTNRTR